MWKRALSYVADLLYPSLCLACDAFVVDDALVCSSCVSCIQPLANSTEKIDDTHTMTVIAASRYEGPLVRLVMGKQWQHIGAARVLGKLIAARLQTIAPKDNITPVYKDSVTPAQSGAHFDVMIAVPLHWRRYAWRGYNQAYEIARVVRKECGIKLVRPFQRVRHTPPQATLPKGQRAANMSGAFAPCDSWERARELLAHKHVLLIDDVYTTGGTVRQLAKCALRAGAASVTVAVACRAGRS